MTALLVARFNVTDADRMEAYGAAAGPLVSAYGGVFLEHGLSGEVLEGEERTENLAVFRFPDVATAKQFFSSEEYQSVKALRAGAAEMHISLYEATAL